MAETAGDANPAASSGAVAEDDGDVAFLEAARSAAAASLEKRRAHLRAREARARSATVATRAPNLGSIDESRVVNGDGRTDTIAGASNASGVARKVVARASGGVDRLAGTPASHRRGDENENARDDGKNANKTALGDDVSPALVRGREAFRGRWLGAPRRSPRIPSPRRARAAATANASRLSRGRNERSPRRS